LWVDSLLFRQIKHIGDNFSYIIAEKSSGKAAVVDPSFNGDEIIRLARQHGLDIEYIIDTHHHPDHVAGNEEIRSGFGSKVVAHRFARIKKDVEVVDGSTLAVGRMILEVIHTPGHTPDSICLLVGNRLLTGDTLFVGECGRTDLPGGSARDMYNSLFHRLMKLDDGIEVYPGHDYGPSPHSTIGVERRTNYTLSERSLEEFLDFMKEP